MNEDNADQVERTEAELPTGSSSYTRWAAVAVLIAAVPALLLSTIALAVFYAAPGRFENILDRLPGEAAIRTILIFAPVTLLAIVVLAGLYALEKPTVEVTRPRVVRPLEAVKEPIAWPGRLDIQRLSWWVMLLTFVILFVLIPVRSAAFLSPTHFENFLGRYPGEGLITFIIHSGPIILLILEVVAVTLFVGIRVRSKGKEREGILPGMRWLRKVGPTRVSVGVVLVFSLPILFVSLASLVLFFVRTESFLNIVDRLPGEVPLRMGLIFIPASLIIVVALAVLFLFRQRSSIEMSSEEVRSSVMQGRVSWELIRWYFSWFLAWVNALAGAAIVGLVMGVVVLLIR
jgi:hypothetical protein